MRESRGTAAVDTCGGSELGEVRRRVSITDLPNSVLEKQLEHLVATDLTTAVRMSITSKELSLQFADTLARRPEMCQKVLQAQDDYGRLCVQEATVEMALAAPSTTLALWMATLSIAVSGMRGRQEWRSLEVSQWLVHAYSLTLFSRSWPVPRAKDIRLIFDFSLSLAGSIFSTLLASKTQTRLSATLGAMSFVNTLLTSVLLLSLSTEAGSWRSTGGTLHKVHSRLTLLLYFVLAFHQESLPGTWKLASAICRLLTLVYKSWMNLVPEDI